LIISFFNFLPFLFYYCFFFCSPSPSSPPRPVCARASTKSARRLHPARAVVVGDDFRFGHRRSGSVQTLRESGAFEVIALPRVRDADGAPISSTRVRELITAGQLEQAHALLGEPYTWAGVVVRGDGRGRGLGYPTANLAPIEPLLTPPEGVYACWAHLGAEAYPAAVSVGAPPMFAHARGRIEAYLIGLPDHDLYGRMLTLRFLQRLRPQQKFESIDALLQQMQQDTEQAAKIAANQGAIADRGNL